MKVLSKIRLSRKSSLKNYQKAKKNKTLLVRAIRKQKRIRTRLMKRENQAKFDLKALLSPPKKVSLPKIVNKGCKKKKIVHKKITVTKGTVAPKKVRAPKKKLMEEKSLE